MTAITRVRVCLCLATLAVTLAVGAGDIEVNFDASGPTLNDVYGLTEGSDAVFWAVGDSGKVFKIVNGSIVSEFTLGNSDYDLHGVSFLPSGDTGYIVGYKRDEPDRWKGVVFRSTSGGIAWQPEYPVVQDGINVPFLKVQCVPSRYIWVTCGDGYVLWRSDGSAWAPRAKPGGDDDYSYLWGLWCIDSLHDWVASDQSRMIAKTENMACSWDTFFPLLGDSLSYRGIGPWNSYSPDFANIAVASSKGKIVYTTNGGSNWADSDPLPDACQWWRGISHEHGGSSGDWVGTSGTWLPGTAYGSHGFPRCSKDYDINDVDRAGEWHVAVGTHEAIYASYDGTPGLPDGAELRYLDAVSGPNSDVTVNIVFFNYRNGPDTVRDICVYRSICQEDWGTSQAAFYELVDHVDSMVIPCYGLDTVIRLCVPPSNSTYWYGATVNNEGYSASPNVDSARALARPTGYPPSTPPDFQATDVAGDHGWNVQFDWSAAYGSPTGYALVRLPATDYVAPYHYGHKGGLIAVTNSSTRTAYDTLMLPGYEYRRGVRSFNSDGSSAPAVTFATSVDNVKPPMVTGLTGKYVAEIDAAELWWDPTPERGDPANPDTFEPNHGGYWVCPDVVFDYNINHPSPLFRNHYIERVPDHGCYWVFAVCAQDRTGNRGAWSDYDSIWIPSLATTSALATAYNNGTHLARVPGTANEHIVYESNDEVRYANSTDGGIEWQNRTTLDTGASPTIATDDSAHVWTVYLKDNTIRYKSISPSVAWSGGVLYDPDDPTVVLGPPTVTARTTSGLHYAYCAFPLYDLDAGTSVVKVVKFDDTTSVVLTVEATPNQAMSDSFVSISLTPGDSVHCVWQRGSSILYSEARVTPTQWSSISWTSPSTLTMPGSDAKHPFCAAWGNRVIIVWSDQMLGEIMRTSRVVATQGTWNLPANVSLTQEFSDFPQASSPCAVSWQDLKASGKWEVRARAGTELITLTEDANGNSRYVHISAELADSSDSAPAALYASWTDGTAEDDYYEVKSRIYDGTQDGGMAARQVPITVTELSAVAPNPFSRSTGIRYQLARPGRTKLSVFDAAGREVRTLVNSEQNRGAYTVTWDGTDVRGRSAPRGVYFLRFAAPDCTRQRKLTLTR